jgi:sulfane dehydrogenase subunit SoxC
MPRDEALRFPAVGPEGGLEEDRRVHAEELQLAFRNHAMPLEALRYDVTPAGLHYLLTHYDIPETDAASWTLGIDGAARTPLTIPLRDLMWMPSQVLRVTLECAGDGRALLHPRPISQPWLTGAVGTAEWRGTPLKAVLERAGIVPGAVEVLFTGADRGVEGRIEQDYQRSLPLDEALRDDVLLAWEMNGQPLLPQHGAPLRLVAPGWYGMAHVKWLRQITLITEPFNGYQQALAYRYSQDRRDPGEPVTLMLVRSLMIPPGIPDFLTRWRLVTAGPLELRGRAWSGRSAIARVEVSTDGGAAWADASVAVQDSPHAWQGWRFTWLATPGDHELLCRATDAEGHAQPIEQPWNGRGMGNNGAHRVPVRVVH